VPSFKQLEKIRNEEDLNTEQIEKKYALLRRLETLTTINVLNTKVDTPSGEKTHAMVKAAFSVVNDVDFRVTMNELTDFQLFMHNMGAYHRELAFQAEQEMLQIRLFQHQYFGEEQRPQ
jgi:hypothetical protein